ncbi:DJ-1/PfpI family protein [Paraburkholderia humisilvae]|uniref:DJ-1/PfpI domain-containing protein n=1 Tax=Paraburkholderia humisilvae TaxID=627669 RepID=A0A6J5F8S5_9BURK|nr:DJ-1/PfpI family protein [Paraburkholderia humisilvae]CAB3774171.1 hypothetical protein LMG29542_07624 [Paraburkholderia humisilvae]
MKKPILLAIFYFATWLFILSISAKAQAESSRSESSSQVNASGNQSASGMNDSDADAAQKQSVKRKKKIGIVIFPGFEALDVYGPVEVWGDFPDYEITTVSEHDRAVKSAQGVATVATYSFEDAPQFDILMVPGGAGVRREVSNPVMLNFLRNQNRRTEWTTSVCTGAALLAKAGILKGHRATTNKIAFKWVASQDRDVLWQGHARWVVDGKYITSSGVSAGTDMAFALEEILYGRAFAEHSARVDEYIWNDDPTNDPFAVN